MEQKKVAIIGAGVSGLAACKFTLSKGLIPMVFEARGDIGGVWTETLETTALQTPKEMFQFSDFPWPKSVTEEFPRYDQVLDYLRSYAQHFGLLNHIRFNSRIVGIDYEGCSDEEMKGWTLWGGSGEAFDERRKWRLNVVDARTNIPLQVSLSSPFLSKFPTQHLHILFVPLFFLLKRNYLLISLIFRFF